jgi:hydrogenase nickel incorporation protein HypB
VTVTNPETGQQIVLSHDEAHALDLAHEHASASKMSWLSVIKQGFLHSLPHTHSHHHPHAHNHAHSRDGTTIALEQEILGKNQLIAERNRGWLLGRGILALNLVSSPGSGKTTLLERTVRELKSEFAIGVIEGDQETVNDAERIRATGCKAVQINTGTGCHLEAEMLERGLLSLQPALNSLLFIENVGNLVCPALFDLGERAKVAVLSVTEGEDKPLKYPHMFRACQLLLLNKIDLLPYLNFDVARCLAYAKEVNPQIEVLQVSATTGVGMSAWYDWIRHRQEPVEV